VRLSVRLLGVPDCEAVSVADLEIACDQPTELNCETQHARVFGADDDHTAVVYVGHDDVESVASESV
jgi:hypothetical protein